MTLPADTTAITRPRRWLQLVLLGGGLLALVLLWLPIDTVDSTFSGPSRTCTHVGLLSPLETTTRYAPRRFSPSLGPGPMSSEPVEPVWDHHGTFGNDIVVVRVLDRIVTINYLALTGSVVATLLVGWLAVVRPTKKLMQSLRRNRACSDAAAARQ